MNGERYNDNCWKRWLRDWWAIVAFLTFIFYAGVSYNAIAENTKARADTHAALKDITVALQTQAEINGRVGESVKTLQETVKALLEQQIGVRSAPPGK